MAHLDSHSTSATIALHALPQRLEQAADRLNHATGVSDLLGSVRETCSLWQALDEHLTAATEEDLPEGLPVDDLRRDARYVLGTARTRPVLDDSHIETFITMSRNAAKALGGAYCPG